MDDKYNCVRELYVYMQMYTGIWIMILDVGLFSLILLLTLLLWRGEERIHVLGWIYLICLTITSAVPPLSTIVSTSL